MNARTMQRAFPGLSAERARQLVGPCNKAMLRGKVTTRARAHFFCAQVGHESESLFYKAEIGGPRARYAPYYGRTFIQITWKSNYLAFGQWLGVGDKFVRHPELLERDQYAFLGAVWYWTTHGLNGYADRNDFRGATKAINGGYNGWDKRVQRLGTCQALGDAILPVKPDPYARAPAHEQKIEHSIEYHRAGVKKAKKGSVLAKRHAAWLAFWTRRARLQMRKLRGSARKPGGGGWSKDGRSWRYQLLGRAVRGGP